MTKIIGLKDLRLNTESYISQVKKGNSFIVMKRSEPAFKISPYQFEEVNEKEDDKGWKTMIDFTKLTKNGKGIEAGKLLSLLRKIEKKEKRKR